MLPASTGARKPREVIRGRQDGRAVEIQRLIGRSLRGVVDFAALGELHSVPDLFGFVEWTYLVILLVIFALGPGKIALLEITS